MTEGGWGLRRIGAEGVALVALADAREWVRVEDTLQDTVLTALIAAAEKLIAHRTDKILRNSTWRLTLPGVPGGGVIMIPRGNVTAVIGVTWLQDDGATVTMDPATYGYDLAREPVTIAPAAGSAWPAITERPAAITVDFQAGYTSENPAPENLRLAIQLLVGHWFDNREAGEGVAGKSPIGMAIDALIAPERLWGVG